MAEEHAQETGDTGVAVSHPILPSPEPVEERPRDFSLKYVKEKWIPITVSVVITALIITIIALAAKKTAPCPSCPSHDCACPDGWVGFQGKCYYFSGTEENWSSSQIHCSSLNATLALIDSIQELNFTLRYTGIYYHWIGLQREQGQPWKWSNGTIFNNLFPIKGEGQCAFLNLEGVGSSRCFPNRHFICNQRDECSRWKLSTEGRDTISKIH